ncbi:MAG: hypothetical protein WAV20_08385 [Blastocatellia bacterium]
MTIEPPVYDELQLAGPTRQQFVGAAREPSRRSTNLYQGYRFRIMGENISKIVGQFDKNVKQILIYRVSKIMLDNVK